MGGLNQVPLAAAAVVVCLGTKAVAPEEEDQEATVTIVDPRILAGQQR